MKLIVATFAILIALTFGHMALKTSLEVRHMMDERGTHY